MSALKSTPPNSEAPAGQPAATPMMRQYQRIRQELPTDVLLFFRLGDFYELFNNDAIEASAILNVTLTKRQETPMCGVPYHAAEHYIGKLIQAGKRVAICEQKGEVLPGKLVEREVTQIVSAGTVSDARLLDASRNHYLAAACCRKDVYGFAYLDLTTGEFRLTELSGPAALLDELGRVAPAEFLVSDDPAQARAFAEFGEITSYDAHAFVEEQAAFALREHFGVHSLDGFGCADLPRAVAAAGALLHYLRHTLRRSLDHLTSLKTYHPEGFLVLDGVTQTHLEIVRARSDAGTSLLQALDRTVTPLGARQLRQWLLYPLRDLVALGVRQDCIASLLEAPDTLRQLRETLREVRDLERTVGRLSQANGSARDLLALTASLQVVPELRRILGSFVGAGKTLADELAAQLHPLPELAARLEAAVSPDAPLTIKDGGMIRENFHADLDELRRAASDGKSWIAALQEREIVRTGIKSLKIRYNSVFGYYIEVTKSNLAQVPEDYRRKQTTAGGERFFTPELKEVENRILGAEDKSHALELTLFHELRVEVLREAAALQGTAAAIAAVDALGAFAETARLFHYCRPTLRAAGSIHIHAGRHPVLDQQIGGGKFVPNDVVLDGATQRLIILTGPNMAGKSTYLRQTALLVLLAQTGSFIPAAVADIGLVDRIFTRVGASDDLARGQSTFLVEMNETANIIHHATAQSLVILDEIGRGTATYDGLSIAWSVAEHLHDRVGALTLFATHYHELTEMAHTHAAAKNFTVAVREWNEEIVFLHKIISGAADRSYGIQVARLAGLPDVVIERAKEILSRLEAGGSKAEVFRAPTAVKIRRGKEKADPASSPGFDWFNEPPAENTLG